MSDQIRLFNEEEDEDELLDKMQRLCEQGIPDTSEFSTILGPGYSTVSVNGQQTIHGSINTVPHHTFGPGPSFSPNVAGAGIVLSSDGLSGYDSTISLDTQYKADKITLNEHYGEIKDPKAGTMIFDGLDKSLKFYNGTHWEVIAQGPQRSLDV